MASLFDRCRRRALPKLPLGEGDSHQQHQRTCPQEQEQPALGADSSSSSASSSEVLRISLSYCSFSIHENNMHFFFDKYMHFVVAFLRTGKSNLAGGKEKQPVLID